MSEKHIQRQTLPCMWSECYKEYSPEKAVEHIAEAGFRFIDLGGFYHLQALQKSGIESACKLREKAKDLDARIIQTHAHPLDLCHGDFTVNKEQIKKDLDYSHALGAELMVVHPGSPEGYGDNPDAREETLEINRSFFDDLSPFAEEYGVFIAIENLFNQEKHLKGIRFGSKVEDLLLLLDKLDNPQFGICWDTGHANLQGLDQNECIRKAGLKLIALHLNDNNGIKDQHCIPYFGSGTCDWEAIIEALQEVRFPGPLNFEIPGSTDYVPLPLRDEFIRYCYKTGEYMCESIVNWDF